MPKKIEAKIIADSINESGTRITTYVLTYPRFIHAELMTHRVFSRNSASSRAIPFEKMLKMVEEDPFIPIAWQKDHKGMQGTEYINPNTDPNCAPIADWLYARDCAVNSAKELSSDGITKQLCNRLLEPFMWHTVIVTATEYDNFFELRCPKYKYKGKDFKSKKDLLNADLGTFPTRLSDIEWLQFSSSGAEIHIQALAEAMWDAMNESAPKKLKEGEWHIPFGDQMELSVNHPIITKLANEIINSNSNDFSSCLPTVNYKKLIDQTKAKIAVARCARLSYMTFDGEINYEKDNSIHISSLHFTGTVAG